MIVVDASLAAKWVFWEPDTRQALAFLAKHEGELAAPDLLWTEVFSALVRRARSEELDRSTLPDALEELTRFWRDGLVRASRPTVGLMRQAVELALMLDHKLPDCFYLALALELDCDLATCDAKFHAKAFPHFPQVKLLAHFDA